MKMIRIPKLDRLSYLALALALSNLGYAQAQSLSQQATPPPSSERVVTLPPIALMNALSDLSLESLHKEADAAYQARNWPLAEKALDAVLELAPGNRKAIFRLGNIAQQKNAFEKALLRYRELASAQEFEGQGDELSEKALVNMALIGNEIAKDALASLDRRQSQLSQNTSQQIIAADAATISDRIATTASRLKKASDSQVAGMPLRQTGKATSDEPVLMIAGNVPKLSTGLAGEAQPALPARKRKAKPALMTDLPNSNGSSARGQITDSAEYEKPQVMYLQGEPKNPQTLTPTRVTTKQSEVSKQGVVATK